MNALIPALCCLVAALLIGVGHWFPWQLALGRELSRVEAYSYGVLCIVLPTVLALLLTGDSWAALVLCASVGGAGGMTLFSKYVDADIARRHRVRDLEDKLTYVASEGDLLGDD